MIGQSCSESQRRPAANAARSVLWVLGAVWTVPQGARQVQRHRP